MILVAWHRLAALELNEAAGFLASKRSGLRDVFLNEAERCVAGIAEHPEAGHLIGSIVRRRMLRRFPCAIWTALLALCAALAASPAVVAQSISPLDPPDTSRYLRWGPFRVRPGFAISDLGYDNNVFAVTDQTAAEDPGSKVGDYFIALSPRIQGLVLFGHRAFLTFDERLEFYAYARQSEIDYFNNFFNSRLTFPFRRLGLYADVGYDRTRDRPYDNQGIRPLRKAYPLGAGLIVKFGWRTDAELGYLRTRLTADDPSDPSAPSDPSVPCNPNIPSSCTINELNDRTEAGARLKARYLAFGRTRVLLEVSQRTITFNDPDTAADRNGEERRQLAGLDFGLGGTISGTFRVGHANFNLTDPTATDFNGPVADIALSYNFGGSGSRVTFTGYRDVRYTVFDVNPIYVYTGGNLKLIKYFNRFLGIEVGAGRANLNFLGSDPERVDNDTNGSLGLLFRISENDLGRRVEYAFRYTRWVVNSTLDYLDQNRGTIGFGVSFGY
jgi:hypothetical protein